MDYQCIHNKEGCAVVEGVRHFSLSEIVESGQCFRWERTGPDRYRGVAHGRVLTVSQKGADTLVLHDTGEEEFHRLWRGYFDLGRDYGEVKGLLSSDPVMARAIGFSPGMRVLRQDPWETLCSFILSANNNIARIKGIVGRLCALLGDPLEDGPGGGPYTFPPPERLAGLTSDALAPLRCGYRARYLLDAARMVASGELALEPLGAIPVEEARARLRRVSGVGPKVAECVLLYGFARAECVPVDVWIGRALSRYYPGGMPPEIAPVAGLAQQYLFHYMRLCPEAGKAGAVQAGR